jgi:hypothetical protein
MIGWLKSWWGREICTSDRSLIDQWEKTPTQAQLDHELTKIQSDMDRAAYGVPLDDRHYISPNLVHSTDAQMINRLRDLPTEDHRPINRKLQC